MPSGRQNREGSSWGIREKRQLVSRMFNDEGQPEHLDTHDIHTNRVPTSTTNIVEYATMYE
jgi:hypothetical protein